MTKTVINLDDTMATLVAKVNDISTNLGDIAQLTTGDSNAIDAINGIYSTGNNTYDLLIAYDSASKTLTNKTFNLANNTFSGKAYQLRAAIDSDTGTGALVFASSPTLATATLSSPTITTPSITEPTITAGTGTGSINLGAGTYKTTNWTWQEVGTKLYFKYGGVSKMSLDGSGNLSVVGDITAFASSL